MSETKQVAVGFDLGGTACKLGIFEVQSEELQDTATIPIRDGKRPGKELFGEILDKASALLSENELSADHVVSVCVASAGILGPEGAREPREFDRVLNSPNLPGIHDFNVRQALHECFPDALTFIENDAKAAGWAEWFHGAGKDPHVHSIIGFTLGTGLGGFMIVDGKMIRPGELGHSQIDSSPDAAFCGCGTRGCAEAYISKVAIRRIGGEVLEQFPKSKLAEIGKSPQGFDPLPIAKAADEGDEGCRYLYDLVGQRLGKLIWNMKRICDPDVVVCAGNIAKSLHLMLPGIQAVLAEDPLFPKKPAIVQTKLGPGVAGMIGAGALAVHGYLGT